MSLTSTDLQAIRQIVGEEIAPLTRDVCALQLGLKEVKGELTALGNDVKEIYNILVFNGLKIFTE